MKSAMTLHPQEIQHHRKGTSIPDGQPPIIDDDVIIPDEDDQDYDDDQDDGSLSEINVEMEEEIHIQSCKLMHFMTQKLERLKQSARRREGEVGTYPGEKRIRKR